MNQNFKTTITMNRHNFIWFAIANAMIGLEHFKTSFSLEMVKSPK